MQYLCTIEVLNWREAERNPMWVGVVVGKCKSCQGCGQREAPTLWRTAPHSVGPALRPQGPRLLPEAGSHPSWWSRCCPAMDNKHGLCSWFRWANTFLILILSLMFIFFLIYIILWMKKIQISSSPFSNIRSNLYYIWMKKIPMY